MLAHHEAWHRFEDFAGAHDRTFVQLRGRHGALACRRRDPDEVRRRIFDIRDVSERSGALTMTSALSDSDNTTSAVTGAPLATFTDRRSTLKLSRRNVSSALPGGTASNRYAPASSVVALSSFELTTRSIATPGKRGARLIEHAADSHDPSVVRLRRRVMHSRRAERIVDDPEAHHVSWASSRV